MAILYRVNVKIWNYKNLRGKTMKYIKQITIIMTISLLGEVLAEMLPFTIPASVYGLFLMLIALMTRIIRVEHVKESSDFLMDIMPIMFVPASVGLMVSWGLLKEILVPVLIVSVFGTIIVMIVSGKTVDGIMRLTNQQTVMTDGISIDGEIIEDGGDANQDANRDKNQDTNHDDNQDKNQDEIQEQGGIDNE